jgi:hypothetical protein
MRVPSLSKVLIATLAALVLLALALAVQAFVKSREMPFIDRADKANVASQLFLRSPDSGELWRVFRRGDGANYTELRIGKRDGSITQICYDRMNSPVLVNDYYPVNQVLVQALKKEGRTFNEMKDSLRLLQLSRQTEVRGSQFWIASERTFRPDGSLKSKAVVGVDLHLTTYRDSDQSIESEQVFNGIIGVIKVGTYWREDGRVVGRVYQPQGEGIAAEDVFRPDGTLEKQISWISAYHTRVVLFAADGKTMLRAYDYTDHQIAVSEIDSKSQKPTVEFAYRFDYSEQVNITYFDARGNRFIQTWQLAPAQARRKDHRLNNGYFLRSVKETFIEGHDPKTMEVLFYPGSLLVSSIKYGLAAEGFKVDMFRPDGSLESTESVQYVPDMVRSYKAVPKGKSVVRPPLLAAQLIRRNFIPKPPAADLAQSPALPKRSLQYQLQVPKKQASKS